MEKFFEPQELANLVLQYVAFTDLQKVNGVFFIDRVVFKKVTSKKDMLLLKVDTTYGVLAKGEHAIQRVKREGNLVLEDTRSFITYFLNEYKNKELTEKEMFLKETTTYDEKYLELFLATFKQKELLDRLNLSSGIYEELKDSNTDTKYTNNLNYIEGTHLIKEQLKSHDLTIGTGKITREAIEINIKRLDQKYEEFTKYYLGLKFNDEQAKIKSQKIISNLMLMKITKGNGKFKYIFTTKQPIEIKNNAPEIVKINIFLFTDYYLKYIRKEIRTKKELVDMIYIRNKMISEKEKAKG